jgi:hypothetical protein
MTRSGWPLGPTPRPFAVADLARRLGINPADTKSLHLAVGITRRWIRRYRTCGLTARQADIWACRVGLHPLDIWPHWADLDPDIDGITLGHPEAP